MVSRRVLSLVAFVASARAHAVLGGAVRASAFARTPRAAPRLAAGAAPPQAASSDVATLATSLAARVPELLAFAGQTLVVKYGGHAMTDDALAESFYADVVLLRRLGVNVVIVHGGGPQISGMLKDLGVQSSFVDGRRVTDERTMEVVEMVLGGLVNNKLVNALSRAGGKAVGLTGHAAGVIGATRLEHWTTDASGGKVRADLGLVGEPTHVRPALLLDLVACGAIPVIAPIGVGVTDGQSYNINADTAAGAVAAALGAARLLLLTDVVGVLDRSGELMRSLCTDDVSRLVADGTISGGMIPKLETACDAVTAGVGASVILDGRVDHALLLSLLPGVGVGTTVGDTAAGRR
ncbi:hypothetical protein KFE25_013957 [Diacronema lutheri]|uniref:acetylglutamate kinase n=1 Tax=Diacronema lutheri TaxID=2081491 RepID=A0A8J5XDR7_DIALT|nr:hypothetical protein KFE25_013957 [Diacronema lutheri]